jgi:hypothetical protein
MAKILKANTYGTIEVAISDIDYASQATEETIAAQAQISVNSAAANAGIALTGANTATAEAAAAKASAEVANTSEFMASAADTEASVVILAMRLIEGITGNIVTEATTRATKAAYYSGKAIASAKEATNTVDKAGFKVVTKQTAGIPGAAGATGTTTLLINSNIDLNGNKVTNISPSPEDENDAVSAKWVRDLLNGNVEIKWL